MTAVKEAAPREEGDDFDDPRSSSAAQCIRFRILLENQSPEEGGNEERLDNNQKSLRTSSHASGSSYVFGPEFTHQVFPGEWIRGYQPFAYRHDQLKPHRSFVNHILATHEVGVEVVLAPDCATCTVAIRAAPLESGGAPDGSNKRVLDTVTSGTKDRVGSVTSPSSRAKRPRRHASTIADKRMKQQSQDEESEDDLPTVEGNKTGALDINQRCDEDASLGGDAPSGTDDDSQSYDVSSEECDGDDDFDDDISDSNEKGGGDDDDDETRSRRMTENEIRDALAKALPPIVVNEEEEELASRRRPGSRPQRRVPRPSIESVLSSSLAPRRLTSYLSEPVGTIVGKPFVAHKKSGGDSLTFVLTFAEGSNPRVADYHGRVQRLATWFIETADEVDVANRKDGGYWRILYLFRRHDVAADGDDDDNAGNPTPARYSLAGYMTLYHFRSPFRKPKPGIVVRICQALVLPPYQRMRLGHHMLNRVYDSADQSLVTPSRKGKERAENIVEFNVEDPAPAFTALRNCVDYDRFRTMSWFQGGIATDDESFFSGLSDAQASEASTQLKITPTQIHIVHELEKLRALTEHVGAHPDGTDADEPLQKRYRLMVKKRLNRQHREDLGGLSKQEAQRVLGELYEDCHRQYLHVLRSCTREKRR